MSRPLFDQIDKIEDRDSDRNLFDIFDIKESDGIKLSIKKLQRLQQKYHPDKCDYDKLSDHDKKKCEIISKEITAIIEKLKKDDGYNRLRMGLQTSSNPQGEQSEQDKTKNEILDLQTEIKKDRRYYIPLIETYYTYNQPGGSDGYQAREIASLILEVIINDAKFKKLVDDILQKFIEKGITEMLNRVNNINIMITLLHSHIRDAIFNSGELPLSVFVNDTFDTLNSQLLHFIEKIVITSQGNYELHDIIDSYGFRKENSYNDYCISIKLFNYLMRYLFGSKKIIIPKSFSSFRNHLDKCIDDINYIPYRKETPQMDSTDIDTLIQRKFIDLLKNHYLFPLPKDTSFSGGSKSRRIRRRKHNRKTHRKHARKTHHKRVSKSHKRRRHSRLVRKHKKHTRR